MTEPSDRRKLIDNALAAADEPTSVAALMESLDTDQQVAFEIQARTGHYVANSTIRNWRLRAVKS